MSIPRFIDGRKYWFQNYLEHWKLLATKASGIKPTIVRGLLLSTLGLLRWVARLAETYLSQEELRLAMSYSLRKSVLGSLMMSCIKDTQNMLTFGSRLQRKNPKLVGENDPLGLFVTQVEYIEISRKPGSKGNSGAEKLANSIVQDLEKINEEEEENKVRIIK